MNARDRIIVALDVASLEGADALVQELAPHVGCFKVGLELCTAVGPPQAVEFVKSRGGRVLLDLKFKDIPNTMAGATRAAASLGVEMFTVHATCGLAGMQQAVANKGQSKVLAVTVLTSLGREETISSYGREPEQAVVDFADTALQASVDGIICSPRELPMLVSQSRFQKLLKVTPGVRPAWAATSDQKRVMTPAEAIKAGADYLVIGRPITQPPSAIGSPVAAARLIIEEVKQALYSHNPSPHRELLARILFDNGAIQFGAFKLKLHEKHPEAPLSPIYLNLRTSDNPKPGPLTIAIMRMIGMELSELVLTQLMFSGGKVFECVAGVPNAGDPFAEAFHDCMLQRGFNNPPLLRLEKKEADGERHITKIAAGEFQRGDRVIIFDDLITGADSKLEAIEVLERAGLVVKDVVVLVDREQGGRQELERRGYRLHSVFTLSELLDLYVREERMTPEKRNEVLEYLAANQVAAASG